MTTNLFDYFEEVEDAGSGASAHQDAASGGAARGGENGGHGVTARAPWAARAPRKPNDRFDVKLVPRAREWQRDPASLAALERLEGEPWVDSLSRREGDVELRLSDAWIETTG